MFYIYDEFIYDLCLCLFKSLMYTAADSVQISNTMAGIRLIKLKC